MRLPAWLRRTPKLVLYQCPVCGRAVHDTPEQGARKYCVCGSYMQAMLS